MKIYPPDNPRTPASPTPRLPIGGREPGGLRTNGPIRAGAHRLTCDGSSLSSRLRETAEGGSPMRKLLILGVAALTALLSVAATAAPALAAPHKHRVTACTDQVQFFLSVTKNGTNFYLGVPNKITSTSVAILKPAQNSTTQWTDCVAADNSLQFILKQGNTWYALTTRDISAGGTVSLEKTTNNGTNGTTLLSQRWTVVGSNPFTFNNLRTLLFLRVRNSGPTMYQTVTTGLSQTMWTVTV